MIQKTYSWLDSYPAGVDWHAEIPKKPAFSMLQDAAEKFSDRGAFDFLGKKYTWSDIHDLATRFAKGLQDQGVRKGDHVGLFLPNCPYYLISYYAVLMTGAVVVNLNPLYAKDELAHLIEDSELDLVITLDLSVVYDKMEVMLASTRLTKVVVCKFMDVLPFPKSVLFSVLKAKEIAQIEKSRKILFFSEMIDNPGNVHIPEIDPEKDLAVLQYTGGTTGRPKGAMLSHYNVYANAVQAKLWCYNVPDGDGKMLGVLPFFHVFAMTAVMNLSVVKGYEIIATPRFVLKDTLKIIHKKKPAFFPAVPAVYSAINNAPDRSKYDMSSLKVCISGGAPLPVEVKRKFEKLTGCVAVEGYGLSESSPVACVNPVEGNNKAGSIGLPVPGTIIEIVDKDDKTTLMPVGERGELCIRGPQVMLGYWNKPDATKDTLRQTPDGDYRLYTGDIAILDEEGYVYIVDRLKDMIITNGYNVYPRNVEEAIYKHPNVEECIVAGIPDDCRGEIVKAWIKCKEGRELSAEDLKEFLADRISPMEIPKRIEFRDEELPKTMIGKLSRKDIVAQELSKSKKSS